MRISVDAVLALVHTFLAGVVIYLKKPWFAMHPAQAFYWLMGLEKVSLSQVMADPWAYLSLTTLAWAYLYAMVLVGIYFLFNLFFVPYNNVGNWHDPLTGTDGRLRGSHFKDAGDMPPAFPNCWFRACDTIDVEKGKTRAETLFNQDLVVFRGKDGKIGIVNVGCPSCKASLVEAKVQESSIKCSGCAHEYDREGKCVSHPTSERVHSWHVEEGNGHIYIWHDAEDMPPTHKPTMVEDIANGSYFYHGRTEHCITAHVAEMPENGPDVAHLNYLHANFLIQSLSPFILHKWAATWHHGQSEKDKHCGYVILDQRIHIGGKYAPGTHIHVEVVQCGLGLVCLRLETPFGFVYVFESVTPVRPLYQKFHHLAWAEWRVPRTIAKGVLMGLVAQAERDMPVWNHKTYKNKPVLVKGDGPISVYRKWVKQFFREANWSEAPDMMPRPATRAFWINQAEANNNAESTTTTAAVEAH